MSESNNKDFYAQKIVDNIKRDARISLTINKWWEEIKYGVRDKDLIMFAISEILDEELPPRMKL